MSARLTLIAALASALPLAAPAAAQAPGNAIEDRSRLQTRQPTEEERQEAILTGDTDIVLTRRTRLFTLSASAEIDYTSNAFLAADDPVDDGYAQGQVSLGVGTTLGGKVAVFASAGLVSIRYFDHGVLDYNAAIGLVGASTRLGRLSLAATYQPTLVYTRDFGARQLTSHRLRLSARLPSRVGRMVVEPGVFGERTIAHPSDYNAWAAGASLDASMALSRKAPVFAFASAEYQHRSFDAYFPSLLGVDRRDDMVSAGAGVAWRPSPKVELRLSYSFQHNSSTSDVNRYDAHGGRLGVAFAMRF